MLAQAQLASRVTLDAAGGGIAFSGAEDFRVMHFSAGMCKGETENLNNSEH